MELIKRKTSDRIRTYQNFTALGRKPQLFPDKDRDPDGKGLIAGPFPRQKYVEILANPYFRFDLSHHPAYGRFIVEDWPGEPSVPIRPWRILRVPFEGIETGIQLNVS